MSFDEQTLAALACVAIAVAVLCRRVLLWWRGQSAGCGGGCHGCGGTEPAARLKVPLTVIELPSSPATVKERPPAPEQVAP